jgi:hypothetical protein
MNEHPLNFYLPRTRIGLFPGKKRRQFPAYPHGYSLPDHGRVRQNFNPD